VGTRDTSRDSNRESIVGAGLDSMLSSPMAMLRSLLNASSLSTKTGMSKDTTYRLFQAGNRSASDAIVEEVAAAATRPEWSGFVASAEQIATAFQDCVEQELPFGEAIVAAMAANAEAQFHSPGGPVGWIFHAAALTASPLWQGDKELSDEDRALAERLLGIRARFYERMAGDLLQFMIASMSLINRRPRRGMDPRQLLALMHSLIDGAVLRRYIEPEIFDNRMIGEAVYALALAFSEEGTLSDPRRPAAADAEALFDAMLERAAISWDATSGRTVDSTAREAGVALETAHLLFPSLADLADAVVWSGVLGGGSLIERDALIRSGSSGPGTELALILGLLRRLRDVAEQLPGAVALVRRSQPVVGTGVRTQLEREVAEVLRSHCPGIDPLMTAAELVGSAITGRQGWGTATSLMRVLERTAAADNAQA